MSGDVVIDRRRFLPQEPAASLPLQAKLFARIHGGRLDAKTLQELVDIGAISRQDNPDEVNALFAQGW
jgi:hypothetical protein